MGEQVEKQVEEPAEIKRFHRCINDLVSLLALPTIWSGNAPSQIVETLLDALVRMLSLDFAYARLNDPDTAASGEILRVTDACKLNVPAQDYGAMLRSWLERDRDHSLQTESKFGEEISVFPVPLGIHGKTGMMVVGSERPDFPSRTESLLLSVAANQASIGLQEARLLTEQKRIAVDLDRRVAERTAELAATNEELRKEITERKLAEQKLVQEERELKRNEERWRSVFENSAIGVALADMDGRLITTNPVFQEMVGYSEQELKGVAFIDITQEEDRAHNRLLIGELLAGKRREFQIEKQYLRKDGTLVWARNNVSILPAGEGIPRSLMSLSEDVTERKRAEDALKSRSHDLKLIIDTIPALVWSTHPDGSVDFYNQHYLDYTGFSLEQALGWGWKDTVHPDDVDTVTTGWRETLASGKPGEGEHRLRRRDGVYRWFFYRACPLRDENGNIVKWYGILADIEDRKRAEEEIRGREEFLSKAQRLSLSGSFSWYVDTNEVTFSEEAYRIYGFEPGTPATLERIANAIHPDDRSLLAEKISGARGSGGEQDYEIRLLMPDGSIKYVHGASEAIREANGRTRYLGAIQDVTGRHQAEAALDKARSELAHVARVTALGGLTASIAHEVSQPLSGIVTNASTCLRMLDANPPNLEGARETVRRTIRDGNRASEVITRLRALYSKKESSREPIDLNEAAREVTTLSLSEIQRGRVTLRFELGDNLLPVIGDRIQLQQVILNLLRNAVDAMSAIDDRPRELLIRTEKDEGNRIRLSVKDSGVGLTPQAADNIFEAFYTTKTDGMGIGLSVSRSIIEAHQGRIWATPNDGPGCTFSFAIPCAPEVSADAETRVNRANLPPDAA